MILLVIVGAPLAGALLLCAPLGRDPARVRWLSGAVYALVGLAVLAAAAVPGASRALALPTPVGLLPLDPAGTWWLLAALALSACGGRGADRGDAPAAAAWLAALAALALEVLAADALVRYAAVALAVAAAQSALGPAPSLARRPIAAAMLPLALLAGVGGLVMLGLASGTTDLARLAAAPAVPAELVARAGFLVTGALYASTATLVWRISSSEAGLVPGASLIVLLPAAAALDAALRYATLVFPCYVAGPCGAPGLMLPAGLALVLAAALARYAGATRSPAAVQVGLTVGLAWTAAGTLRAAGIAAALFGFAGGALSAAALAWDERGAGRGRATPERDLGRRLLPAFALGLLPGPAFVATVALLEATAADALAVWTLVPASLWLVAAAAGRAPAPGAAPGATNAARRGVLVTTAALVALGLAAAPALEQATAAGRRVLDRAGFVAAVDRARVPADRMGK